MVVTLAHATKDHDHTTATALRSVLGVLACAESVLSRTVARGPATSGDRPGIDGAEVTAIIAAEADQRERAAERYRQSGDLGRARRMQDESEVLRAFLDD
jgi:uncharacterized protein YqeY